MTTLTPYFPEAQPGLPRPRATAAVRWMRDSATIIGFIIGIGLYGSVYVVPLFLGRVRGYSALEIGVTMMVTASRPLGRSRLSPRPVEHSRVAMGSTCPLRRKSTRCSLKANPAGRR